MVEKQQIEEMKTKTRFVGVPREFDTEDKFKNTFKKFFKNYTKVDLWKNKSNEFVGVVDVDYKNMSDRRQAINLRRESKPECNGTN